jgi:transposase InsO family protein
LTAGEEQEFYQIANSKRFRDMTPAQIVAILAGEGTYIASESTLYRILRKRKSLEHRQQSKKPSTPRPAHTYYVSAPDQVYSWDITWLKTEVRGIFLYAYTIIDLYDRSLVGWSIEENESDEHATRLFARLVRDRAVLPKIVHSDNGHPMRGVTLAVFLDSLMISRSFSRPRCSNDNAYYHKTMKYTVGYPEVFTSINHVRSWYAEFVHWYNTTHLNSTLGYVTPLQRRSGEADQIYATRNKTIINARKKYPLRWRCNRTYSYASKPVSFEYRPLVHAA